MSASSALAAVEYVEPRMFFGCPKHVSGDRDFWGYGPDTTATVTLRTDVTAQTIWLDIDMFQNETAGDRTRAETHESFPIATAPGRTHFTGIWLPVPGGTAPNFLPFGGRQVIDSYTIRYVDENRSIDTFNAHAVKTWLRTVEINGDTKDDDVGYGCGNLPTDSWIRVYSERLELQRTDA